MGNFLIFLMGALFGFAIGVFVEYCVAWYILIYRAQKRGDEHD